MGMIETYANARAMAEAAAHGVAARLAEGLARAWWRPAAALPGRSTIG
jgi:hypothetical protein